MENKRTTGTRYEALAADYLEQAGVELLERNYRCRAGEIDLIGREPDGTVVFYEIKYRRNTGSGSPAEAVNHVKIRRICRTADHYRMMKRLSPDTGFRFDVIGILGGELTHIRNAFDYVGLG